MTDKVTLLDKAQKIEMLVMDVDGVMTDGSIWLGDDGVEIKKFNIYDGQGIYLMHQAGIKVGIITGRKSNSLSIRAKNLNISELHQGVVKKLECYNGIKKRYGFDDEQMAYIGDDLIDLAVLRKAGLAVAVANAVDEVKCEVDMVTGQKGGDGAVRELINLILRSKGFDFSHDFWDSK